VAAPVFNLIAEAALGDYAVPPDDKSFRESLAALSAKYEASAEQEEPSPAAAPIEIVKAAPTPTPTPKPASTPTQVEAVKSKAQKLAVKGKSSRAELNVSANVARAPGVNAPLPLAPKPPPLPRAVAPAVEMDSFLMPELRGRGVRAVMQACGKMHLTARLNGSGVAVRQFPVPGARVKAGDACKVDFE
jgi:hypothetical protein